MNKEIQENDPSTEIDFTNTYDFLFKLLRDIKNLAGTEAQLAIKSTGYIVFLLLFTFSSLIMLWLIISAALVIFLVTAHFSLLFSLCIVAIFHLTIIALFIFLITSLKKNIYFTATRRQLDVLSFLKKEIKNEGSL